MNNPPIVTTICIRLSLCIFPDWTILICAPWHPCLCSLPCLPTAERLDILPQHRLIFQQHGHLPTGTAEVNQSLAPESYTVQLVQSPADVGAAHTGQGTELASARNSRERGRGGGGREGEGPANKFFQFCLPLRLFRCTTPLLQSHPGYAVFSC